MATTLATFLLLRSVHDRDRLVGPLSRDEGDRHAAVHGAASRVRARDPLRRIAVRGALGPVGKEEDTAAGLDGWGLLSVLSALGVLFSIASVFLFLPLVLRETPLSRKEASA